MDKEGFKQAKQEALELREQRALYKDMLDRKDAIVKQCQTDIARAEAQLARAHATLAETTKVIGEADGAIAAIDERLAELSHSKRLYVNRGKLAKLAELKKQLDDFAETTLTTEGANS